MPPAAVGWVGLGLLVPTAAFLILLPLAQRRPAVLGRRGLMVLTLSAGLAAAPQGWLPWEAVAGVAGGLAAAALVLGPWVVIGARAARVREALEASARGIRAKFEPAPAGIRLTKPPGRVRVVGALGLAWLGLSLDRSSKKHALLAQVLAKGIRNLRF